jgi:CYTH domain-containing protein
MAREEYNLPLTKESYKHLKEKVDGRIIHKTRYVIPMSCVCPENADFCSTPLFLELDIFHDDLAPLILAEIEFPDEETANTYPAPQWLGEDVTFSSAYHNNTLSRM